LFSIKDCPKLLGDSLLLFICFEIMSTMMPSINALTLKTVLTYHPGQEHLL